MWIYRPAADYGRSSPLPDVLSYARFVPAYGIGAALVLFCSLYTKDRQGQDSTSELDLVLLLRNFYQIGASTPVSCRGTTTNIEACKQACRMIDHLLASRPSAAGTAALSMVDVFRQISSSLLLPSNTYWTSSSGTPYPANGGGGAPSGPPPTLGDLWSSPTGVPTGLPQAQSLVETRIDSLQPRDLLAESFSSEIESETTRRAMLALSQLEVPAQPLNGESFLEGIDWSSFVNF